MSADRYCVIQRTAEGQFIGVISGMGRHRGTWDSDHSRRQAQRHAAALRRDRTAQRFTVEPMT